MGTQNFSLSHARGKTKNIFLYIFWLFHQFFLLFIVNFIYDQPSDS